MLRVVVGDQIITGTFVIPLWCYSTVINNALKLSFDMKAIFFEKKIPYSLLLGGGVD